MGDLTKPGFDERTSRHATGSVRLLAAAPGYRVSDMRCWMGPNDSSRENQFPAFRVSAIISGSFGIRSNLGQGLAVAGSLLMGNACECYLCRHDTAAGDRCVNFDFDGDFLENVRVALGARGVGDRFNRLLLPPSWESIAIATVIESIDASDSARALEEAAFEIAAAALTETHTTHGLGRKTSFRNERAVVKAARYIEANFDQPCTLDELAAEAGMSPFHFVRVYRRVICQTPYRHLIVTRLRHAAKELRMTRSRIADIAVAAGFGDLSTFNASFVRAFGTTPTGYRRRHSAAALPSQ